jgi:MerR family transcriptional regulator, redox-sensitive transcriptional activator SoxR
LRIGALASRSGVNATAIRYYEKLGLIEPLYRVGRQRIYPEDAVYRTRLILFASCMGFTLTEIKLFLSGFREKVPLGVRWKKLAKRKLREVEDNMRRARQLKDLLEHLLECRCGSLQDCVQRLHLSPGLRHAVRLRNRQREASRRSAKRGALAPGKRVRRNGGPAATRLFKPR